MFDVVIINDDLDKAYEELTAILIDVSTAVVFTPSHVSILQPNIESFGWTIPYLLINDISDIDIYIFRVNCSSRHLSLDCLWMYCQYSLFIFNIYIFLIYVFISSLLTGNQKSAGSKVIKGDQSSRDSLQAGSPQDNQHWRNVDHYPAPKRRACSILEYKLEAPLTNNDNGLNLNCLIKRIYVVFLIKWYSTANSKRSDAASYFGALRITPLWSSVPLAS